MATRDPAATRQRIIDAALAEFSEKGIAGARVDSIVARAGVNKRMLYHYFGSKLGLFEEILRQRLSRPVPGGSDPAATMGERLAAAQIDLLDQREYVRLLMWEALERGSDEIVSTDARVAYYKELIDRVRQRQATNEIDPALDPAQAALTQIALVLFPLAFPQVTKLVTGHGPDEPAFAEARAEFLRGLGL